MKRYIIIIAMLVLALGLNAQTTNRDSRSSTTSTADKRSPEKEEKATAVKPEATKKSTTPARAAATTPKRNTTPPNTNSQVRKVESTNNQSRNRETPAVRTTTVPRKVETAPSQSRTVNSNSNRPVNNGNTQERPRATESRNTTINNQGNRSVNGNSNGVRPADRGRTTDQPKTVNSERNREYVPRTEPVYVEKRKTYNTPERQRVVRTVNKPSSYVYHPVEYRRTYYPYAEPRRIEIIWDSHMYHEYRYLYPNYDYWYYPYGYRIHTISSYEAGMYVGEVARIYGKVYDVWYSDQTDEYYLYFGGPYPFQDFSVIIKGKDARRFSYRPERYFTNRNIVVTGLVSMWEDRPEMVIRKRSQIETYF